MTSDTGITYFLENHRKMNALEYDYNLRLVCLALATNMTNSISEIKEITDYLFAYAKQYQI